VHRDAYFYVHAHHELCGEGVLTEAYDEAFHTFEEICPECTTAGAGENCTASENEAWSDCGNITVGSGRPLSACEVHVEMVRVACC
jgi:hypothetical protein